MDVIYLLVVTDSYGNDISAFYTESAAIEAFHSETTTIYDEYAGEGSMEAFFDYYCEGSAAYLENISVEVIAVPIE